MADHSLVVEDSPAEAAEAAAEAAGNKNKKKTYILLGGNMSLKDEFKLFVKKHPELIDKVNKNETSWQKLFEIYSLYGEEDNVWNKYFNKESTSVNDIINMVKNVDLDSVQKNITNISKALGLVQSLITKDEINKDTYTPRPLYKKFED
ncbi:MAG: hypothetical protein J6O62_00015 [Bacilli bacterium]|nr:hypothetical protein [Bacilli bacterium]